MPCAFFGERPSPFQQADGGCQFAVPEGKLIEFDGVSWCPFHLPMSDAEGNPGAKAAWPAFRVNEMNAGIFRFIEAARQEERPADLSGVVFPGLVSFGHLSQGEDRLPAISFAGAWFGDEVRFSDCRFADEAWFADAVFAGPAWFAETVFFGEAIFDGAQFTGVTTFQGAAFLDNAYFRGEPGESPNSGISVESMRFTGAVFLRETDFSNRSFLQAADFVDADFHQAPKFHNCELRQYAEFRGARFRDKRTPCAPRAYRELKHAMEKLRAWNEMAMFHAFEQISLRRQKGTPLRDRVMSLLYELGSDYGRNFVIPLLWLFVFGGGFFFLYGHLGGLDTDTALTFTVQQYVRPFAVWFAAGDVLLKVLASLQSLLGITLVTLFVLAVRRRFRMG